MPNIIIADKSYKLSELAAATANADTDIFYVVKLVDGEEVAYKITRAQLLSGLGGSLAIENAGTAVGNASTLNFVPGTNITFTITDAGSGQINVQIAASGSVAVAWGAITGTLSAQTDLQAALDAKVSEADVIGTNREYTAGQGFEIEDLTITAGTPNTVAWSVDGSNMKRLILNSDAELQVPTGTINATGSIEVENDGGNTLTFAAGLNTAYILGDTPTTTDTEYCLITWERRGSRIWIVVNNQN